jgi:hypothetical protein
MVTHTNLLKVPVVIACKSAPIYRGKIRGSILTEAMIVEIDREGVVLDDGSFIYSSNIASIGPYSMPE